jgi:glyoxylase-like metal-dependent hydrolase (beta-lactamase superfamily II)
VGRPDLAQKAADMTQEQLAATLYKSLREKVMTLADDVLVYPAHGAGSACGKNMSKETVSTIGEQKKSNYASESKHDGRGIRERSYGRPLASASILSYECCHEQDGL